MRLTERLKSEGSESERCGEAGLGNNGEAGAGGNDPRLPSADGLSAASGSKPAEPFQRRGAPQRRGLVVLSDNH